MADELISVIVPVYNSEKFIERCAGSILKNTYQNLEIIFVNDGSKDNSGKFCDILAQKDRRIKVIHQKNQGTAVARNIAIENAKGEYIAFVDNDDFLHDHFFEYMLNALQLTRADIVVCELTRTLSENEFKESIYDYRDAVVVDKKKIIKDTYENNWTRNTAPWNKLYKRHLFDKIKFPKGKGYEDAYTTYRLLYEASNIAYINATLYYWYDNRESYSSKKSNPSKLLFREEAIRLQTEFYKDENYRDVAKAAQLFYLKQLFLMDYQLMHDFEKNAETLECEKIMRKKLKRTYFKCYKLIEEKKESLRIFEWMYPTIGGIIYKCMFNCRKDEKKNG